MNSVCCWCCLMSFKARHVLLNGKIIALCMYYFIQCLICVIKWGDGSSIRGWRGNNHSRNHSVDPLKWLPACSSNCIVCTYTLKITVILLHFFFKCLGSFCVTQNHRTVAATQSLHWVHADIWLLFWWEHSQCHWLMALFHCMVRYTVRTARYGTAQFGRLHFHRS